MMTFAQLISQSDVVDGKIVVESSMEELSDHDDSVAEKLALLEVAGLSTIALMMPTRRYLRSARIASYSETLKSACTSHVIDHALDNAF